MIITGSSPSETIKLKGITVCEYEGEREGLLNKEANETLLHSRLLSMVLW